MSALPGSSPKLAELFNVQRAGFNMGRRRRLLRFQWSRPPRQSALSARGATSTFDWSRRASNSLARSPHSTARPRNARAPKRPLRLSTWLSRHRAQTLPRSGQMRDQLVRRLVGRFPRAARPILILLPVVIWIRLITVRPRLVGVRATSRALPWFESYADQAGL
jgi:hypothetical protein